MHMFIYSILSSVCNFIEMKMLLYKGICENETIIMYERV